MNYRGLKKTLLLIFIIIIPFSCKNNKKEINFYYWKSKVSIGNVEKKYFQELNSRKLYLHFFDVVVNNRSAEPIAKIKSFDQRVLDTEYIPVIFIVNDVFKNTDDVSTLPKKLLYLINLISDKNKILYDEIQIDCDWTASTKETYFSFLEALAQLSGKKISCTLRLHQIKDQSIMGIPPVSKGYLMCYATSSPKEASNENSILDLALLQNYTKNLDTYPIPFAVALPIFSWGVVTNHIGDIRLINNIDVNNLPAGFIKKIGNNTYEAQEDFFLQGIYINKGFSIRIESISKQLLEDTKNYLDKKINHDYEIVYYHLDKPFLENYTIDDLKKLAP